MMKIFKIIIKYGTKAQEEEMESSYSTIKILNRKMNNYK